MHRVCTVALLFVGCERTSAPVTVAPVAHEQHGHSEIGWSAYVLPEAVDGASADESLGALRSELVDGELRVANELTSTAIATTLRFGDGLVLVTKGGAVYRTGSASDRLFDVDTERATHDVVVVGDRIVGLDVSGFVWFTQERRTQPLRKGVLAIAASDDALFVLDADGTVQRSDRGSEPFVKVPTRGCVMALEHGKDGVEAITHGGREQLAKPGVASAPIRLSASGKTSEEYAALQRLATIARLADGTIASLEGRGIVRLDGTLVAEPPDHCVLERVGAEIYGRCVRNDGLESIVHWSDGRWQTSEIAFEPSTIVLGSNGWFAGRGYPRERDDTPAQWLRSDGATLRVPERSHALHAIAADWAVWSRASTLVAQAIAKGNELELGLARLGVMDELVYALERDEAKATLVIGPPLGELSRHAVPEGTTKLAMASATHGIAAGRDATQIWVTTDGAQSWERLDVPIVGERASVYLHGDAVCSNVMCRVGQLAWVDSAALGSTTLPPLRIVASRRPPGPYDEPPRSACKDPALAGLEEAVVCTGDRCTLDRKWLRDHDKAALEHAARVLVEKDGSGLKLYGIRSGTLFKQLGLKNGDLVVAIDGTAAKDEGAIHAALRKLGRGKSLRLDYQRKGVAGTLTITGK
ncbi:MAG TPA: PDZ domain-containing protein [Nannocystaceae bacterium]|nr:PDZ domain-containing protein [Nannocystaceae bacterium]